MGMVPVSGTLLRCYRFKLTFLTCLVYTMQQPCFILVFVNSIEPCIIENNLIHVHNLIIQVSNLIPVAVYCALLCAGIPSFIQREMPMMNQAAVSEEQSTSH